VPLTSGSAPRTFSLGTIALLWCIPATLATLQNATLLAVVGGLQADWVTAAMQFPRWLAWAPLTPVIVRATRSYPFTRGRVIHSLLFHILLAVLLISAVEIAWTQLAMLVEVTRPVAPQMAWMERWRPLLSIVGRLVIGLLTYAVVVGLITTVDSLATAREQSLRSAQLAGDLALAQVHALKMHIHPHFLFNTLHAIGFLVGAQPEKAKVMITRLGDLLRVTLKRASVAEVPLREELDILQHYLAIESVRFEDRLTTSIDVTDETYDALVPHLMLQPLVENAIKHGVTSQEGEHTISVHAERVHGTLLLEVRDNGPGPSPDARSGGIGLNTVRARLSRLYGASQSLTLRKRPDGGCSAVASIPYRTAPSPVKAE
jgi:two-component system LytT family sensor kinase